MSHAEDCKRPQTGTDSIDAFTSRVQNQLRGKPGRQSGNNESFKHLDRYFATQWQARPGDSSATVEDQLRQANVRKHGQRSGWVRNVTDSMTRNLTFDAPKKATQNGGWGPLWDAMLYTYKSEASAARDSTINATEEEVASAETDLRNQLALGTPRREELELNANKLMCGGDNLDPDHWSRRNQRERAARRQRAVRAGSQSGRSPWRP